MSMDVSTGDIITPGAEKHTFTDMFDGSAGFELWSYPVETVLAEKLETILSRGTENTRPRDFYDVYKLSLLGYDSAVLKDAFEATAAHRGSLAQISRFEDILADITRSAEMAGRWEKYAKLTPYASGLRFEETVASVRSILSGMNR